MATIVSLLPEVQALYFNVDLMFEGYSSYLKYKSKEVAFILEGDDVRTDVREDERDNITYEA